MNPILIQLTNLYNQSLKVPTIICHQSYSSCIPWKEDKSEMSYTKFIQDFPVLENFFQTFPKHLMELALKVSSNPLRQSVLNLKTFVLQEKVAKFSGERLSINLNQLRKYLQSKDSIFEIDTLQDFLETLHILNFKRCLCSNSDDDAQSFRFVNPNFVMSGEVPDEFYKLPVDHRCKALDNTVPIVNDNCMNLLHRLLQKDSRIIKLTKRELARLRLSFALQKRLEDMRMERLVVDYEIDDPDYMKNNEIAGFYGSVGLADLNEGFQKYFPMLGEQPEVDDEGIVMSADEDGENEVIMEVEAVAVNEVVMEAVQVFQAPPVYEPPIKKRKVITKRTRERQETAQAIFFLENKEIIPMKLASEE